jgi:hypothetical protein
MSACTKCQGTGKSCFSGVFNPVFNCGQCFGTGIEPGSLRTDPNPEGQSFQAEIDSITNSAVRYAQAQEVRRELRRQQRRDMFALAAMRSYIDKYGMLRYRWPSAGILCDCRCHD